MLAWLYWNPPREIFSLPFFTLPLRWYGLLFALGFFLGYRLLLSLLRKSLALRPEFKESDIRWTQFERWASDATSSLYKRLGGYFGKEKSLKRLNELLLEIEEEPKERWIGFIKRKIGGHLYRRICARRFLETTYPECFITLEETRVLLAESITGYVVAGTLIGARLGHILFYENIGDYLKEPLRILKVWEGGLASHGATAVILLMLAFWVRQHKKKVAAISFLWTLDHLIIPGVLAGGFIRIGNFFNQEILGAPSDLPWAILFGNPADGGAIVPRHPAQLYEALFYFGTFGLLLTIWRAQFGHAKRGFLTGLGLVLIFGFRFLIEFIKLPQSKWWDASGSLLMGQWLSLPLLAAGLYLLLRVVRAKGDEREFFPD